MIGPGSRFALSCTMTLFDAPDLRRFVENLHDEIVCDIDAVARLAIATHELLENAVKFSADGKVTLRVDIEDSEICIATRNLARPEDLDQLLAVATQIKSASDTMAGHLALIARAPSAKGGLGLGRIAAEGKMQIGLSLEGNFVEVRARSRLAAGIAKCVLDQIRLAMTDPDDARVLVPRDRECPVAEAP